MENVSLNEFQKRLIKSKLEPSIENSIERIDRNIKWWSHYQDYIEHIQEIFLVLAFISVFFDYKVITGASIALSGSLSRAITNSIKRQNELKNERKTIYKDVGVDKYLPHETESNNC